MLGIRGKEVDGEWVARGEQVTRGIILEMGNC